MSSTLADGGDQAAAVLTFLMLPVALTDSRRWHWDMPQASSEGLTGEMRRLLAHSGLLMLRVQVAFIYWHASIGKLPASEWADGTALYYWLQDPLVGAPGWMTSLLHPLLTHPTVALLTWGVLVLEFALFLGLVLGRPQRRVLLVLGMGFHTGIIFLHGLVSFVLVMFGALIVFLRPHDEVFSFRWLQSRRQVPLSSATRAACHGPEVYPGPHLETHHAAAPHPRSRLSRRARGL